MVMIAASLDRPRHYMAANRHPALNRMLDVAFFLRQGQSYYGVIRDAKHRDEDFFDFADHAAYVAEQHSRAAERAEVAEAEVLRLRRVLTEVDPPRKPTVAKVSKLTAFLNRRLGLYTREQIEAEKARQPHVDLYREVEKSRAAFAERGNWSMSLK